MGFIGVAEQVGSEEQRGKRHMVLAEVSCRLYTGIGTPSLRQGGADLGPERSRPVNTRNDVRIP